MQLRGSLGLLEKAIGFSLAFSRIAEIFGIHSGVIIFFRHPAAITFVKLSLRSSPINSTKAFRLSSVFMFERQRAAEITRCVLLHLRKGSID